MAQTLDQINALRYLKGEEPLTELPVENDDQKNKEEIVDSKNEIPQEGKDRVEPAKIDTPAEDEKPPITNKDQEKKELISSELSAPIDLDDAAIFEALKKRGINVNSFEELTPKETVDPEKAAEQRDAEKLSFALSKGLYSKKEYENYVRDSNDLQNLVYSEYYKEAKQENPDLTDQEIQEAFLTENGLDADPSSMRYKRGVNGVAMLADKLLREKYSKIYNSEKEFETYEQNGKAQKERHAKILLKAPAYKKDVEDALKEVSKAIVPFDDKESLEATFSNEAIENVKKFLLQEQYSVEQIEKGWDKEDIKEVAYTALLKMNFSEIVKDIATQYLYKNQKGTKGIPTGNQLQRAAEGNNLSEKQQEALNYYFPQGVPGAAAN